MTPRCPGPPARPALSADVTAQAYQQRNGSAGRLPVFPAAGNAPVYLLTMKGHFIGYLASHPSGAATPTGIYLSMVVDARTFRLPDWGLSPKPPPVSPAGLGPVTYLRR